MAKRRQTQTEAATHLPFAPSPAAQPAATWSRTARWLVSGLIVLQLVAVVAEPFRFFTRSRRGTSPLADPARLWLAPYVEFAYLNHGYFFFAPEPGPSHLLDCQLTMPDGRLVSLTFPDKQKQWPRLLYHRHFMLAEFLHQLHVPPFDERVAGEDQSLARDWRIERQTFEQVRQSMSAHVASKFGAQQVRIERLEHRLPSDDEVFRQRLPLNDPQLYVTLPDAPLVDVPLPDPAVALEEPSRAPSGQTPADQTPADQTAADQTPADQTLQSVREEEVQP